MSDMNRSSAMSAAEFMRQLRSIGVTPEQFTDELDAATARVQALAAAQTGHAPIQGVPGDERAAFEAWGRADTAGVSFERDDSGYVDLTAALLWHAWQARSTLAAEPAAPADARDATAPAWMLCESRRPWAANSLRARAAELREAEKRCRSAFRKDYMGEPARYVADAFGDAASAFEARLAVIDAACAVPNGGAA